ncbi:MAG: BatA domain-containing protein [Phycisphaeraceae bacterium]
MFIGPINVLNPLWLWGLAAAVGVPLAAHLLSRWGGRLAVFPTIRFIQQASADCARWTRPRHWLLLILRCGLLALIVGAFARPVWYRQRPATDPDRGVVAAIILDRSASMTRTHHGATLFDEAKRRAIDTLRRLDPARDRATVILLDATPGPLLPEPSANFSLLVQLIEQTEPTLERGDLDAALRAATIETKRQGTGDKGPGGRGVRGQALGPDPRRSVLLFSDMQATQWQAAGISAAVRNRVALRLHRIGQDTDNLAVYRPTVSPVQPVVGQDTTVSVEVANFGQSDASAKLSLRFAGKTQTQAVRVVAGATATANFTIRPVEPGATHAVVELAHRDEHFDVDDRTGLAFTVVQARPVALITDADIDDSRTAVFFVARALMPEMRPDGSRTASGPTSGVALRTFTSRQLQAAIDATSRPSVVVIVEAHQLDVSALNALRRYLADGGGVIWVIDSPEAADLLQRFGQMDTTVALSPIRQSAQRRWLTGADFQLAEGRFDLPILSVFEGPARTGLLSSRFNAVMRGRLTPTAELLLTFADGSPALATQWVGSGRLAVFAAALSPAQSDLVKAGQFLPLLHQLVRGLTPGPPASHNPHPGDRPSLVLDGDWSNDLLTARDADGRSVDLAIGGHTANQTIAQLEGVDRPGLVQVIRRGDAAVVGGVYVELDPAESDLRAAGADTLAQVASERDRVAADQGRATPPVLREQGVELWPYLTAAALVLATIESVTLALLVGPGTGLWKGQMHHA